MNAEIIQGMICNSTWKDVENEQVFQFSDAKNVLINGKDFLEYSLGYIDNKFVLQVGSENNYILEYVNDFVLYLDDGKKKIKIMPD